MKFLSRFIWASLVLSFVLVSILPANAQVLYGSVVGVVTDPSGSAIPNAEIALTNRGTGQNYNSKTDESGCYSIGDVLPGGYDLKITANGFRTYTRTDLVVTANTVARAEVRMEVG